MSTTTGEFGAYLISLFFISLSCGVTIQLYKCDHHCCSCLKFYVCRLVNMYTCSLRSLHTDVVSLTPWIIGLMPYQGTIYSLRLVISILLFCQVPHHGLAYLRLQVSIIAFIQIPNWILHECVFNPFTPGLFYWKYISNTMMYMRCHLHMVGSQSGVLSRENCWSFYVCGWSEQT